MWLNELTLNPSVPEEDERRLSRQAIRIFYELKKGPVWTNRLVAIGRQYNARIYEIRQWLAKYGLTIDKTGRDVQGNYRYELAELAGSKYAETMKKKGRML